MYVCQCRAVTDAEVKRAIAAGARTPGALAQWCGAGSGCRGCWPALWELLDEEVGIWPPRYPEAAPSDPMLAR